MKAPSHLVYRCWDEADRLLYVGCTQYFERRMIEHERRSDWYRFVASVTTEGPFEYYEGFDREWEVLRSTPGYFNAIRSRPGVAYLTTEARMAEYLHARAGAA